MDQGRWGAAEGEEDTDEIEESFEGVRFFGKHPTDRRPDGTAVMEHEPLPDTSSRQCPPQLHHPLF